MTKTAVFFRRIFCLLCIFLANTVFAHATRTPVIVDTDMGLDDVRTIILLLHSPDYRIDGIVVTEGASDTASGVKNLRRLLAHFDSSHIPVIRGVALDMPPPPWREHSNAMGWVHERIELPPVADLCDQPADPGELIRQLIAGNSSLHEDERSIYYLCLGPLSTLARALETSPKLSRRISHIYFSGTGPTLEPSWNRLCDPEAFQIVLNAPWKFFAFARPNSEEPALSQEFLTKLDTVDSRAARFIAALHRAPSIHRLVREGHLKFWDDLIALFLNHPDLGEISRIPAENPETYQLTEWNAEEAETCYLNLVAGADSEIVARRHVIHSTFLTAGGLIRQDDRALVANFFTRQREELRLDAPWPSEIDFISNE